MNVYVWVLTIFAAFGGFMFGYDTGVINGVKDTEGFRETFNLSYQSGNNTCSEDVTESTLLGLIVSLFSVGCLGGALGAGALSEVMGRKMAIIIGGVIFTIGGALQTASFFLWMMFVGRIIAGVGVGVLSMVVPIYNAELAPTNLRGRLVSLNQLAITAGIMVSFLADLGAAMFSVGWRVALGIQCGFGLLLVIGMTFLPETPRWLAKQHMDEKASKILAKIRRATAEEVQPELAEIQASINQTSATKASQTCKALCNWNIIQRLLIGVMIQLFQQFTGMNVIMYYSTSIFCKIGVASYISTSVVGALNFFTTILSIVLVDKVGRKALLLMGGIGMLFSMLAAATILLVFNVEEEEGGSVAGYITVALVCFFVFNFAYGWGPIAWVVTSEIYPLNIRGIAVSITTTANWTGNFMIAFFTPLLLNSFLQTHGTFYILSGFLLAATLFVLFTLPETKGESLEKIEELFSKPWLKRIDLFYYLRFGCPWCGKNRRAGYSIANGQLELEQHGYGDGDTALLLQSSDTEGELEGREASFVIDTKGPTMTGYSIARLTDDDD